MTKEEVKNWLESYRFEYMLSVEKRKELETIKEDYSKTIRILNEFKQDNNKKLIEDIIFSYIKDLAEHEGKLAKINQNLREIENILDNVSQPHKSVLYYKYMQGLSTEEIASKLNYSTQRIYQLHDIGISEISNQEKKEDA